MSYTTLDKFNQGNSTIENNTINKLVEIELDQDLNNSFATKLVCENPTANNIVTFPNRSLIVNKTEDLSSGTLPNGVQTNITKLGALSQNLDLNGNNISNCEYLFTNYITETTANAGVVVDTVLMKDFTVYANGVNESTPNSGVTIENVLVKDGVVQTDTINEKTTDAGVRIEGVLIKDARITAIQSDDQWPGIILSDLANNGGVSTRKIGLSGGTNTTTQDGFHSGLVAQSSLQTTFWTPILDVNTSSSGDTTSVNLKCKSIVSASDTNVTTAATYTPSTFTIFNNLTTKARSKNVVTFTVSGGNTDYNVTATDEVIFVSGAANVNLPSPANFTVGRTLTIKNISPIATSNTILPSGGTLEGDVYYILEPSFSITIVADSNKDWWIV